MNKIAKILAASALSAATLSLGAGVEAAPDTTNVSPTVVNDLGSSVNGTKKTTWSTHFNPNWVHNDVTGVTPLTSFHRDIDIVCDLNGSTNTINVVNSNGSSVLDDNLFLSCPFPQVLVSGTATLNTL
jgi:hypothetical protein